MAAENNGLSRYFTKGGKMDWRIVLLVFALGGTGTAGGFFGIRSVAPSTEQLEAGQKAVSDATAAATAATEEVKENTAQVKKLEVTQSETNSELKLLRMEMGTALKHLSENAGRDKAETERRFAEILRMIDKLQELAEKARKVEDLERRVAELERARVK